ncbi:MAG: glycosyltransferase family 4 protein [Bacteroidetes bacterium]|nr:glycosyltransferase family 4 protein [Bacteroidota bacterium]
MKIAIVVHGRFHAFDLAQALLRRGHEVTLLTNYPRWAVARFGFPPERVQSFVLHGLLGRIAWKLRNAHMGYPEAALHRMFSRWAAHVLQKNTYDTVHAWSGVAQEIYERCDINVTLRFLMRGSAHIRTQSQILQEEEERTGAKLDKPSRWMIDREETEYRLADYIVVLSSFAFRSFVEQGVPSDKLKILPLGARLDTFRPPPEVIQARIQRIISGAPLRVLYVGAISYRKGFWDLARIILSLQGGPFEFRLAGPLTPEATTLLKVLKGKAEWIGKRPQRELPNVYKWADVFIFPTIEDGYAVVLAQAMASGLPVLSTSNCSAPDLIQEDRHGWIFPIRSPDMFIDRLYRCHEERHKLADMVRFIYEERIIRDWKDVARDFESFLGS